MRRTKGRTIKELVLAERLRKQQNERSISRDGPGAFGKQGERIGKTEKGVERGGSGTVAVAARTTILVVHYFLST